MTKLFSVESADPVSPGATFELSHVLAEGCVLDSLEVEPDIAETFEVVDVSVQPKEALRVPLYTAPKPDDISRDVLLRVGFVDLPAPSLAVFRITVRNCGSVARDFCAEVHGWRHASDRPGALTRAPLDPGTLEEIAGPMWEEAAAARCGEYALQARRFQELTAHEVYPTASHMAEVAEHLACIQRMRQQAFYDGFKMGTAYVAGVASTVGVSGDSQNKVAPTCSSDGCTRGVWDAATMKCSMCSIGQEVSS